MSWGRIRIGGSERQAAPGAGLAALGGGLFDGLLRQLRRFQQFLRMVGQILRPIAVGTVQSSNMTPERYRELAHRLELPDRLPLTRFERAAPGEATLIGHMTRLAADAVVANYCAMRSADAGACAMRDQHAKSHGCVRAEFVVRDDLPAEFTTALFRPGARYPAIVRFSNGNGRPQSDKKVDGRGMTIKLRDVAGPSVLRNLAPDRTPPGEHDFLLGSFPVFFCKDVVDYSELMDAVVAAHGTWQEKLAWALRWIKFIIRYPRQFATFLRIGFMPVDDPLTTTYHSMSPYLFAGDKVVRYVARPASVANKAGWWSNLLWWRRSDNFLHEALLKDLNPDTQPADEKIAFDFSVWTRHAATAADVEDASLWWTAPLDSTVQLASILIPKQELAADQQYDCERMMFSPWNCLPEHRPLGSLNRMRLAVYLASLQVRRKLNMVSP